MEPRERITYEAAADKSGNSGVDIKDLVNGSGLKIEQADNLHDPLD